MTVQLVVDGHHLHPDVVRLVWAAAAGRTVLVTDATAASGRPDGDYALAGIPVRVRGGAVRNGVGDLAGSALSLDDAVRNVHALGVGLADALCAASERPARLLGRPDIGRLVPGATADVVVLDDALQVVQTLIGGVPAEFGGSVAPARATLGR